MSTPVRICVLMLLAMEVSSKAVVFGRMGIGIAEKIFLGYIEKNITIIILRTAW